QIRTHHASFVLRQHRRGAARVHKRKDHGIFGELQQIFVTFDIDIFRRRYKSSSKLLHCWRVKHSEEESEVGEVNIKVDGVGTASIVKDWLLQRVREVETHRSAAKAVEHNCSH